MASFSFDFGKLLNIEPIGKGKAEKKTETPVEEKKTETPVKEWVWVNGFKATDKDMKCRDFQYELQKCFDISEDQPVEMCGNGFHMCKELKHVFNYYGVGKSHRFFEVKALVRKSDLETYGDSFLGYTMTYDHATGTIRSIPRTDKLVAKSIIFTRELTADEILKGDSYVDDSWTEEDKKRALEIGVKGVINERKERKLVKLGYSKTFVRIILEKDKYDIAMAVGTQEGLSMDMKVWTIFNA